MAIEQKQVQYAKEIDDVMVLVIELIKDIKAKKTLGEIGAENLQNLMNAVVGADGIPGELAANKVVVEQTIGYRAGELAGALIG